MGRLILSPPPSPPVQFQTVSAGRILEGTGWVVNKICLAVVLASSVNRKVLIRLGDTDIWVTLILG